MSYYDKVKIGKYKDVEIWYSPSGHKFGAEIKSKGDEEEETELLADAQKELEAMIDKCLKSARFPIEAIQAHYNRLVKITSFAITQRSYGESLDVWISYPTKSDLAGTSKFGREKTGLGSNFFRVTDKNMQTLNDIQARQTQIHILEEQVRELMKTFENPITKEDILGS